MSPPRFLADHDFNEKIIRGVLRKEPAITFSHVRDFGLDRDADDAILTHAAAAHFVVVSHDVSTMTTAAYARIRTGKQMAGLILSQQLTPIRFAIEDLILIWSTSEPAELENQVWFLPL